MRSDLTSRRLVALTVVSACALGLVACGDNKVATKADTATTTTTTASAVGGDTTTTAPDGSTPVDSTPVDSTVPQIPFDEGVAKLRDSIDAAKGDACKLYAVYSAEFRVEDPKTPDQVRAAIDLTTDLFTAIADAAPAAQAADATKINSGVAAMKSAMETANYSVETFNTGNYFNQDLRDGMTAFTTTAKDTCK